MTREMTREIIPLEFPDLSLKQYPKNCENLFSQRSCGAAVNYWIYDKKRKTIISSGSSRPCGLNYNRASVHAEQLSIEFCRKTKSKNLQIFIWRWSKMGKMKSTYCCRACTQLVKKYGYENDIFTFEENVKVNAVVDNPSLTLAHKMKHGF